MDNNNENDKPWIIAEGKNYYFIEDVAEKDLIGISSYVSSIENALNNEAKFIGLISDYGNGKSTIINKFENKNNNKYKVLKINLWNPDNDNNKLDIHKIFLHQLIDELKLKNSNYFKKRINRNYALFDISSRKSVKFYAFFLVAFIFFGFLNKFGFFKFITYDFKLLYYFFVAVLASLIVFISKSIMLSFKKDNTESLIDENDTKDLYIEILNEYSIKHKGDKIVICLEELDRYKDCNKVIMYLKEFYKFYNAYSDKIKNNLKVFFIVSIKSANQLKESIQKNDTTQSIKDLYEKIFDFIINLNAVNISDYDNITFNLLNEKKDSNNMPKEIANLLPIKEEKFASTAFRYLYEGRKIKIRDIKHRYNFALSLYLSTCESGLPNVSFDKCLYIAYLEDEYNDLYEYLISEKDILNMILVKYARKEKNLYSLLNERFDKDEDKGKIEIYNKVLVDGLISKYISLDYNYYFFKYPYNKESYNIYKFAFYNAIYFDRYNEDLPYIMSKLDDNTIIKFMSKRVNKNLFPDIVFKYPRLLKLAYRSEKNVYNNTVLNNFDILNDFDKFREYVSYIKVWEYKMLLDEYFDIHMDKIKKLNVMDRFNLRLDIVRIIKEQSLVIKNMFFNENDVISEEEIKIINNINVIYELTNFNKITDSVVIRMSKLINNGSKKTIINILRNIYKNNNISNDAYSNLFYAIDFNKRAFIDSEIRAMYNYSFDRLQLNNIINFDKFIYKIRYYNEELDNHYNSIIDWNNEMNVEYYVDVLKYYDKIYNSGMENLNNYTNFHDVFKFGKKIRDEFYNNHYYEYYVKSTLLSSGVYEIETDKIEFLYGTYIKVFEEYKPWKYKLSSDMKKMLYKSINFSKLNCDKLELFYDMIQTFDIINCVINTGDSVFINRYLSKISKISSRDRIKIYELIGNYKRSTNMLNARANANLNKLAGDEVYKKLLSKRLKIKL